MRIYRGANEGITEQCAGSFYTEHYDLALVYSEMEEKPKVYAYNIELKLINIKDTEEGSIDEGIICITDDELNNYDGYTDESGIQICLFGRLSNDCDVNSLNDNTKAIFKKLSIAELRQDAILDYRRYDR